MRAPNDDFTHTAQGWRLLQKNRTKAARGHFLEALRIDPENRWASQGLKAAKSRSGVSTLIVLYLGLSLVLVGIGLTAQSREPAVTYFGAALAWTLMAAVTHWLSVRVGR